MQKDLFRELLGQKGIFAVDHGKGEAYRQDNDVWYLQRKLAARVFTLNNFRSKFQTLFVGCATKLKSHVQDLSLKQKSLNGSAVVKDFKPLIAALTLDGIGKIAFGQNLKVWDSVMRTGEPNEFSVAFDFMTSYGTIGRVQTPLWYVPILGPLLYKGERRMIECRKLMDSYSFDIIKQRLGVNSTELKKKDDILSLFVLAMRESQQDKNGGSKLFSGAGLSQPLSKIMDYQLLRDMVMSFIIAGRDTTAATMSFFMLMMCRNPEVQQKLQAELDSVLGGESSIEGDAFSGVEQKGEKEVKKETTMGKEVGEKELGDNLKDMPYLHGCLYEVFRMFPSVPFDPKYAMEDDVLPSGAKVCAGAAVQFDPFSMGRLHYDDPEEFKPERWIPFKKPSQYAFPVFQAGPRICLGMNMAIYQVKLVMASLLKDYSVSFPAEGASHLQGPGALLYDLGVTLSVHGKFPIEFTPRARNTRSN